MNTEQEPSGFSDTPKNVILIVEDHAETRSLMAVFLQEAGFETIEAFDGAHALTALAAAVRLPHLILTDLRMPNMDGLTLSMRVKANATYRHIPIFLISATLPSAAYMHPDISLFIQKPCNLVDLIKSLDLYL